MRKLIPLILFAVCAYPQTAKFPGDVVTDAQLKVSRNGVSTTLAASMSAVATSFTVRSAANIVPHMILTINSEKVSVCSVAGTTIQVGHSACPNVDGRGFDSTTAAIHATGAPVAGYVDAWHHNAMAAEMKAVQAVVSASGTSASSSLYSFTAQSPPENLIAGGVGQSITMAPCPPGVAGTNTNHYLRLTGANAESVLITGGTCTSGAATGTVTFTPASNHTAGAYTVTSDSGGIKEAGEVVKAAGGGKVLLPANTTILVGGNVGIYLDSPNLTLEGSGNSVIKARDSAAMNHLLWVKGAGSTVRNVIVDGNRDNNGTNSTFGTGIIIDASSVTVERCEVRYTNFIGISIGSGVTGARISDNYIHHNGDILSALGSGLGILAPQSNAVRPSNLDIIENRIEYNHNAWPGAGKQAGYSGALLLDTTYTRIRGNYCYNNHNVTGGQIAPGGAAGIARYWDISGNTVIVDKDWAGDQTGSLELPMTAATVVGNTLIGYNNQHYGIVAEVAAGAFAGNFTVSGNYIYRHAVGVAVLRVAGVVNGRAITITGNRVTCATGVSIDASAISVVVVGNDLADSATPIDDANGLAYVFGNTPTTVGNRVLSPFTYWSGFQGPYIGGDLASGATITPTAPIHRVTGSAAISTITAPTIPAGANSITITLIPTGAWTLIGGGNIAAASTAAVGKMMTLTYYVNTALWYPSY